ncbi:MAG: response regulator [Gammaproteobacteria bacterium]|nr:response regulator [Gammaproteobacteria bacterium]
MAAEEIELLDLSDKTILVVDDVKLMREVIKLSLSDIGAAKILEAADAKRAFSYVRDWQIDLVLLDWEMQPISGIQFLKKLRGMEDERMRQTPVIMVTSSTETKRIVEARDAGIHGYLVKPVSPAKLKQAVAKALGKRRAFISTDNYTGPCRRVKNDQLYKGKERRQK